MSDFEKTEGTPFRKPGGECNHGVTFDEVEAQLLLDNWKPRTGVEFVLGNPAATEVRKRWPRLDGECPYRCGYVGTYYASPMHYHLGDW